MKDFTVILLYPTLPLTPEVVHTYFATVQAAEPRLAIRPAQYQAFYKMAPSDRRGMKVSSFRPVAVLEGVKEIYHPILHRSVPLMS